MDGDGLKAHTVKHYSTLFARAERTPLPVRTGRELALALGYPVAALDGLIGGDYWNWFVPCGNPLPFMKASEGERLLNLGCGAAVDSFALGLRFGPSVRITSLDIVPGVLSSAREQAARLPRLRDALEWACGDGGSLPFEKLSFDWILMNGVFNLFPDKRGVLEEIFRVLRPGGRVIGADLCRTEPLPPCFEEEPDAWAWCMSGACGREELEGMLEEAGFDRVAIRIEETCEPFQRIIFTGEKPRPALAAARRPS